MEFVSNIRRYKQINKNLLSKMIITSNILSDKVYLVIDYDSYTNAYEAVKDNAALMLFKYLENQGVREIFVAGLDGYSQDLNDNYADDNMIIKTSNEWFDKRNEGLNRYIEELSGRIQISSLTNTKYIRIQSIGGGQDG